MRTAQTAVEAAEWTDLRTQKLWMCALILVVAGSFQMMVAPTTRAFSVLGAAMVLLTVLWAMRTPNRRPI